MSRKYIILPIIAALLLGIVAATLPYSQAAVQYKITLYLKDQLGAPIKNTKVYVAVYNITDTDPAHHHPQVIWYGETDSSGKLEVYTVPQGVDRVCSVDSTFNITVILEQYGYLFLFHYNKFTVTAGNDWVSELDGSVIFGEYYVNLRFVAHTDLDENDTTDAPGELPLEPGIDDWYDEIAYFVDNNGIPLGEVEIVVSLEDPVELARFKVDEKGYTGYVNISTVKVEIDYYYGLDPRLLIVSFRNVTLTKEDYWISRSGCRVLAGAEEITFKVGYLVIGANGQLNKDADAWLYTSSQVAPDARPANPTTFFDFYNIVVEHKFANEGADEYGPRTEDYLMELYAPDGTHEDWDEGDFAPKGTAVWAEDFLYFVFPRVILFDHAYNDISTGAMHVKVFFELDGCAVASGEADRYGEAPRCGYYNDTYDELFFVLPDVEKTLGKNYTLEVVYENVLVFSRLVSLNFTEALGQRLLLDPAGHWELYPYSSRFGEIWVRTTLTYIQIRVKDLEPIPQYVTTSFATDLKVTITGPMTIVTHVDENGYVLLPPYDYITPGGDAIYQLYYPGGYLPVPWNVSQDNSDICWDTFYFMKFEYAPTAIAKETGNYVDVTIQDPADYGKLNVLECNCTISGVEYAGAVHYGNSTFEVQDCCAYNFTVFVKLYEVKLKAVSLCGDPLYPDSSHPLDETYIDLDDALHYWILVDKETGKPIVRDPDAKIRFYWIKPTGEEVLVAETTTQEPDGTVPFEKLPAGQYRVVLFWKGYWLNPVNITLINVTGNIDQALEITFPIRNLNLTVYQWDRKEPVWGLNVTILYPHNVTDPDGFTRHYGKMEAWRRTDKDGKVRFELVPAGVPLTLVIFTGDAGNPTPFTRYGKDYGVMVFINTSYTIPVGVCTYEDEVPTWIYSFNLIAETHDGSEVLKSFKTTADVWYNVTALLDDQKWTLILPEPIGRLEAEYRIINISYVAHDSTNYPGSPWYDPVNGTTTPEAIFEYISEQSLDYPHLFIGGQPYLFKVFHGGVMVFNFTVYLPRPSFKNGTVKDTTGFINETAIPGAINRTQWHVDKYWTTDMIRAHEGYTWPGEHPIYRMKGKAPWTGPLDLELLTWTLPLEVYPLSNPCDKHPLYIVPNLKLKLTRDDALSRSFVDEADNYMFLADDSESTWPSAVSYSVEAMADTDGKITIWIPIWVKWFSYSDPDAAHWQGVKFGVRFTSVELLGSGEWGTPGMPSTGVYLVNEGGDTNPSTYATAWEDDTTWAAKKYSYGRNYKENWGLNPGWNLTWWTGSWKAVITRMMEEKDVQVRVKDPYTQELVAVPNNDRPYPQYRVKVYISGADYTAVDTVKKTEAAIVIKPETEGTTTLPNGTAKAMVKASRTAKGVLWKDIFSYVFSATEDWTEFLSKYGISENVFEDEFATKSFTTTLGEDENCATNYIDWTEYLVVIVEDWSEKQLYNMTVFAWTPGFAKPITFDVTDENGIAILYVPSATDYNYEIKVFWRDSWFLWQAGIIPRAIDIYSSVADEVQWKYWGASGLTQGTVRTYVYIGRLKILKADGSELSTEALSHIKVTVTWPDKVVVEYTPGPEGIVPLILNDKVNVKKWPLAYSANFNPLSDRAQSPAGEYRVIVTWDDIVIYDENITIERSRETTPQLDILIKTDVRDFTVTVVTCAGTPLSGAEVEVYRKGWGTETKTLSEDGTIELKEVVGGEAKIVVKKAMGIDVTHDLGTFTGEHGAVVSLTDTNFGFLKVKVTGARGQGLGGADVTVSYGGKVVASGTTAEDGTFTVELPAGLTYEVKASYAGKEGTTSISVPDNCGTGEGTISLNIWIVIAGWAMDLTTFLGLVIALVLLIIVLVIFLHEYSVWRRKKLAAAIVPGKPTA